MKFKRQAIPEVILIEPEVHGDDRGYFVETFQKKKFDEAVGYEVNFVQDNESKSTKGVLRGLHFQLPPFAQSKLVRVIEGEVLDVAVDIRAGSPCFGKYVSVILSGKNKQQLFVPRGFAHGFVVLSEQAVFSYKVDNYYSAEHDRGLAYNDSTMNIDWSINSRKIKLSDKDCSQPVLKELTESFYYGINYYE